MQGVIDTNDIHFTGFESIFEFVYTCFVKIFDFLRHTYLFGNVSLLSLLIVVIVFDLIFAVFFTTFNIYQGKGD